MKKNLQTFFFQQRFKLILMAGFTAAAFNASSQAASIVQDINPGSGNSSPLLFTYCGGLNCIFFVAGNTSTGDELWKYDIASSTASLVKDINPGASGSGITSMIPNLTGSGIIFNANNGTVGNELWKSDGTAAGTTLVLDINPGSSSSTPANFYYYGGVAIFSADNGTNGKEPWLTNGTPGATIILKDINPGSNASDPNGFTPLGGNLLFRANNGTNGSELWISDMTVAGTQLLKDINAGSGSSVPLNFTAVGSNVFFSASDAANGAELWKSDGTAAGTVLVKDINVGSAGSINVSPGAKAFFTAYNSNLYFQATDGSSGYELWKSDGTSAGTTLLKDIRSGSGSSSPSSMLPTTTNLFFIADDGVAGAELWTSDGTTGGTVLLKDINPGAASSTSSMTALLQSGPGAPIYFAANDGLKGTELWRTLGSAMATTMIADINPGATGSSPANMLVISNVAYFAANDGTIGIEPWKFDPLAAGIIDETLQNANVLVFPNPGNGKLFISGLSEPAQVSVLSYIGQQLYSELKDGNATNSIDLSGFESGIYFVKIATAQKETVRKIVIEK